MNNKVKPLKVTFLAVLLCSMSYFSNGQTNSNAEKQVRLVFNQLISVYGSAKSEPQLELIKKGKTPIPPAQYTTNPQPTIKVDVELYKICQTFGKDSLDALAIVLSHELTHYYNDHTFCSDYAFANLKTNINIKNKIREASKSARIEKETEADIKGFFYAAAAGYKPFGLQKNLIEKIYKTYQLPDYQNGYPSKQERIDIALNAEKKANELYQYFNEGLVALSNMQYDEAITLFTKANNQIPFRENLNNIGIAKTRKALRLKVVSKEENDYPERFLYPLEVENKSRLQNERTRTLDDTTEEYVTLLLEAQKEFEKALLLDPTFYKSQINLACVFDLLGKHTSAIAEITEKLPKAIQETTIAKRILAIAYYHADMEKKAEEIWKEIEK